MRDRKGLSEICDRYPRLHLENLPAYAPVLNPIDATWHAVNHPMVNGQAHDIPELGRGLLSSLRKERSSQRVLRGCITHCRLPLVLCLEYCIKYATVSRRTQRVRNGGVIAMNRAYGRAGAAIRGVELRRPQRNRAVSPSPCRCR